MGARTVESRATVRLGCAMRGKLVVGNWKMNGGLRQNDALLADLRAFTRDAVQNDDVTLVIVKYGG